MTSLPIVERELRVAARRRGTIGMRMKIAGVATLCVAACFVASLIAPSVSFGQSLFWGLSGLCMFYCLFAGRLMTADCLSREKREGTLGLLFLTDLKGYDVVLGKLAATSLDGFYVLIALIPFLAVPLLAGGMTNGELWRMALVLVNTFLFSLAVGLFVSAVSRDEQKALGANFVLFLALAAGPPAMAGLFILLRPRHPLVDELFYSCPVYAFWQCADAEFKRSPGHFWWSIATTFNLTLLLALLACRTAPRAWQDRPAPPRSLQPMGQRLRRWWREGNVENAGVFRKRLLNVSAYFWLAARPRLKVFHVWALMGLMACWWMIPHLFFKSIELEANYVLAFMLNVALKLWITMEAGRQLAEDKKSGAFELLLSTPLTVRDMVRGQWMALRRQFLMPVAAAAAGELVLMIFVPYERDPVHARLIWLAIILMLIADVITLSCAAMSAALTEKSHDRATIKTALSVLMLPSLLYGGVVVSTQMWRALFPFDPWENEWRYYLGWWCGLGMFVDMIFLLRARRRLQTIYCRHLSESVPRRPRFARLRAWRKGSRVRRITLRVKLRRTAVAAVALLAAGAGIVFYAIRAMHVDLPKPLIISISQSNNPVRISGSRGFLFILPDGTLWRWGQDQIVSPPRQTGTNRDWVHASVVNGSAVGLRSDGSLWAWAFDSNEPNRLGSSDDWADACAGNVGVSIALKRDGTLWALTENPVNHSNNRPAPIRDVAQVGTNRDWKAISATLFGGSRLALRADGTLWTWGSVNFLAYGRWSSTNIAAPTQLCRESNWVGFCDGLGGGVQNQAGELWSLFPLAGPPGEGVPVAAICSRASSNATSSAVGLLFRGDWTPASFETHSDGTLWATSFSWSAMYPPIATPLRVGQRSDWVSVWGSFDTTIGLTSDGMLWTWGKDYGQPAHYEFGDRFGMLKETIATLLGAAPPSSIYAVHDECGQYYPEKEPRPLLRIVTTNAAEANPRR